MARLLKAQASLAPLQPPDSIAAVQPSIFWSSEIPALILTQASSCCCVSAAAGGTVDIRAPNTQAARSIAFMVSLSPRGGRAGLRHRPKRVRLNLLAMILPRHHSALCPGSNHNAFMSLWLDGRDLVANVRTERRIGGNGKLTAQPEIAFVLDIIDVGFVAALAAIG